MARRNLFQLGSLDHEKHNQSGQSLRGITVLEKCMFTVITLFSLLVFCTGASSAQVQTASRSPQGKTTNEQFHEPTLVEPILQGHLEDVQYGEMYSKLYLSNMANELATKCPGAISEARALKLSVDISSEIQKDGAANEGGIMQGLAQVFSGAGTAAAVDNVRDKDQLKINAPEDADTLAAQLGCGANGAGAFVRNASAYIENERLPFRTVDDLGAQCVKEHPGYDEKRKRDDCFCFLTGARTDAITRADRREIYQNVWKAAQKREAERPNRYLLCSKFSVDTPAGDAVDRQASDDPAIWIPGFRTTLGQTLNPEDLRTANAILDQEASGIKNRDATFLKAAEDAAGQLQVKVQLSCLHQRVQSDCSARMTMINLRQKMANARYSPAMRMSR